MFDTGHHVEREDGEPVFLVFENPEVDKPHVMSNPPRQATLEWPDEERWYAESYCGGYDRLVSAEEIRRVPVSEHNSIEDLCQRCHRMLPTWYY